MPKFKLFATVTEEWVTEIDAEDKDQAVDRGYEGHGPNANLVWRTTDWEGDFEIHHVIERDDNDTDEAWIKKGED